MIYRVMAELGSMSPGPTLYGPALQSVTQSWADAVWSSVAGVRSYIVWTGSIVGGAELG